MLASVVPTSLIGWLLVLLLKSLLVFQQALVTERVAGVYNRALPYLALVYLDSEACTLQTLTVLSKVDQVILLGGDVDSRG